MRLFASNKIRGITIEIGGDTQKLTAALRDVNSDIQRTQYQLRDVEKLLKLDPGNTELLGQKQKLLAQAVKETKDKLETLESTAKAAYEQLQNGQGSQEQLDAIQREIIETNAQLERLEAQAKEAGDSLENSLAKAGQKLQQTGQKISGVGKNLLPVTGALVAAGTAGAMSFAEVDKTMQLTNKTMNNSAEEAELLNKAMKEAAANSTFGMKDAATASLNFARAGLSAKEAAAALAPAMNLAAGEGGNLDVVSGGLVATINGFHGSFDEAGHYADVFAAACNNSALDIDSLSESMSVAAPIFSAAGYTVNDAALYIGVMADNGIEASEAANGLKTGLARLISPTKDAGTYMEQLGISVTRADGSMKDTITIQEELHEKFAKLSESEQIAAASAIFGKNQMAKWLALINAAPEDVRALSLKLDGASLASDDFAKQLNASGLSIDKMESSMGKLGVSQETFSRCLEMSEGDAQLFAECLWEACESGVSFDDVVKALGGDLGTLQTAMDNTKGTTDVMAEAMMSGFGGSLEKLKSSIDVLMTSIGEALAPTIQKVADVIQIVVDKFNALTPEQQETIAQIGLLVAALGPVLIIVGNVLSAVGSIMAFGPQLVTLIGTVKTAFSALSAVLLANPIGLVVAAIGALVAAFAYLWNTSEDFRQFWIDLWESIKEAATTIGEALKELFTVTIPSAFTDAIRKLDQLYTDFLDGCRQAIESAVTWLGEKVDAIVRFFIQTIPDAAKRLVEELKNSALRIKDNIVDAVKGAVSYLQSLPSQAISWGRDLIDGLVDGIRSSIGRITDAVSSVAGKIRSFLHFSVPDEGPLTDYESWMPDFVGGLAQGLERSRGLLQRSVLHVSQDLLLTQPGAQALGGGGNQSAKLDRIIDLLSRYFPEALAAADKSIILDDGTLVAKTAPRMGKALAKLQREEERGR